MVDSELSWVIISHRDALNMEEYSISENERELGDDEIESLIAAMVDDLREKMRLRQRLYERKYRQRVRQERDAERCLEVDEMERYCAWICERVDFRERDFVAGDLTSWANVLALREECARAEQDWRATRERARGERWPTELTRRIELAVHDTRAFQRRLDSLET